MQIVPYSYEPIFHFGGIENDIFALEHALPFIPGHFEMPFAIKNTDEMYRKGLLSIPKPRIVADLIERDDKYEIYADLPGVNKEDIEVFLHSESNVVTLRASRKFDTPLDRIHMHTIYLDERKIFGHECAERSFAMPNSANIHAAHASYQNGVLHLTFPKCDEAVRIKHIEIAGYLPANPPPSSMKK